MQSRESGDEMLRGRWMSWVTGLGRGRPAVCDNNSIVACISLLDPARLCSPVQWYNLVASLEQGRAASDIDILACIHRRFHKLNHQGQKNASNHAS
jgi:hypothetical protein